jgi:hypothetical protein
LNLKSLLNRKMKKKSGIANISYEDLPVTRQRDSLTKFSAYGFFLKQYPLGPLIHGLKRFRIYRFVFTEIFDYENRLLAMLLCADFLLLVDNFLFSILFYCHGVGKITYGPVLLYCCFNGCYKGRDIGILAPCCAKKNSAL